jgi:hypothetical protein
VRFLVKIRFIPGPKPKFLGLLVFNEGQGAEELVRLEKVNSQAYKRMLSYNQVRIPAGTTIIVYKWFASNSALPPVAQFESWMRTEVSA